MARRDCWSDQRKVSTLARTDGIKTSVSPKINIVEECRGQGVVNRLEKAYKGAGDSVQDSGSPEDEDDGMCSLVDDSSDSECGILGMDGEDDDEEDLEGFWGAGEAERLKADPEDKFVRKLADPKMPTEKEWEDHWLMGHWPYRNWCRVCIAAKGKELDHRDAADQKTLPLRLLFPRR